MILKKYLLSWKVLLQRKINLVVVGTKLSYLKAYPIMLNDLLMFLILTYNNIIISLFIYYGKITQA